MCDLGINEDFIQCKRYLDSFNLSENGKHRNKKIKSRMD